jgi:hypothetical protein
VLGEEFGFIVATGVGVGFDVVVGEAVGVEVTVGVGVGEVDGDPAYRVYTP